MTSEQPNESEARLAHQRSVLRQATARPDVSVIVPTFNESDNVPILVGRLVDVLAEYSFEILIVDDDSPDKTWQVAEQLAATDSRVRLLHRIDKRGLSSAVFDGMTMAEGRVYVVMDADLQHDETIIPSLVEPILTDKASITVGSREAENGSYGDFSVARRLVSWSGALMARRLLKVKATDPMSGFFAVSSDRFRDVKRRINPRGFKILLEFLARRPRPDVVEVGYEFRSRVHGTTKLSSSIVVAYLLTVVELTVGRLISARFSAYVLVGAVGLLVRVVALRIMGLDAVVQTIDGLPGSPKYLATGVAIEASILSNYVGNNVFTFSPFRHVGRDMIGGLLRFHLVSGHSLVVSTGVLTVLTHNSDQAALFATWPQVPIFGFIAAVAVATLGNYYLNSILTWRTTS